MCADGHMVWHSPATACWCLALTSAVAKLADQWLFTLPLHCFFANTIKCPPSLYPPLSAD